ncbi:non-specific lipid-transfer protein 3-like [Zingiber officinale]|uniref:non-specific lipid-transfer protein 3-like n=1 Tax=Zingiber officinale TaxID=94328 RepID=UPI001C4A7D6D|nr:non-specific lipid-transfer protein 3-like [Zingiber officinale]
MKKAAAAAAVVVLLVVAAEAAEAQLTCADVRKIVGTSCVNYVTGKEAHASPTCCAAVHDLQARTPTTAMRRLVCNCLKTEATRIKNIQDQLLAALPGQCAVSLSFRLSVHIDCASIP